MLIYNPRLFSNRTIGKRSNDHLRSSKANFQSSFQSGARWSVRSYPLAFFNNYIIYVYNLHQTQQYDLKQINKIKNL